MIDPRLLMQAVMASNDGIVIADALHGDTPLIYVNPAFERLTGYGAEEALDRNCRFLQGEDRDQPGLTVLRAALRNREPCVARLRNYRKDGSMFWNELSIAPVEDETGRVTHLIGIQKDVTARVMAETQLREKQEELEQVNRKLEELAVRDGLTGIFNRRHFDEELERIWRVACRENKSVTLLMIDADFFKQYNDNYGHKAGDRCLTMLAEAFQLCFQRGTDTVARYGGEEFAVLTWGLGAEEAKAAAETLRSWIEDLDITHAYSQVADHVTVSIGVATVRPSPMQEPYTLVKLADDALYRAKDAGRNRVMMA